MSEMEAYIMPDDDTTKPPKVKVVEAIAPTGPQTEILGDDDHIRGDARLVGRAIRKGWNIDEDMRKLLKERAVATLKKTLVATGQYDDQGNAIMSEHYADTNALKAGALILQMDGMDQADDHLDDKNKRLDEGKATENVVERVITVEFDKRG